MLFVARLLIHLVEIAFIAGIIGSAVVIGITFFEDLHELTGDE